MSNKLKQDMVRVVDPKGRIHEMSRPNATDMVQHQGWRLMFEAPPTPAEEFAHAARVKRPRDEALIASRAATAAASQNGAGAQPTPGADHLRPHPLAAAKAALAAQDEDAEVDNKPEKPSRKVKAKAVPKDEDGAEAVAVVVARMSPAALKDELADLEGEEDDNRKIPD